jgi:hypothetical protein
LILKYNNFIEESLITKLQNKIIYYSKNYSINYNKSLEDLNNGLCEELAYDIIEDMGGSTE